MKKNSIILATCLLLGACSSLMHERGPAQIGTVQGGGELYIIQAPSRAYIDWETPSKLLSSYLKSMFYRKTQNFFSGKSSTAMGHAVVHFKCSANSKDYDVWTGIGGAHNPTDGIPMDDGMGVLFKNYDDGYMQSNAEILDLIADFKGRHEKSEDGKSFRIQPHFIKFKISAEQCEHIGKFYDHYARIQFGAPKVEDLKKKPPRERLYYGFMIDPHVVWQEYLKDPTQEIYFGGGCTSVATAFGKIGGVYLPSFERFFVRDLVINEKYTHDYSVYKFLFKKIKKWESSDPAGNKHISIYDPEKIWRFMSGTISCLQKETGVRDVVTLEKSCTPQIQEWMHSIEGALTKSKLQRKERLLFDGKMRDFNVDIDGFEIDLSRVSEVPLVWEY